MHVSSNCQAGQRRWRRPSMTALLMVTLASLAGLAQAVEFDEKVKAPQAKLGTELQATAEGYADAFSRSQASPLELVANKPLFVEYFDLKWRLTRAIDERRPLGDQSALGLEARGDGSYRVDTNAHPQWRPFAETLAMMLPVLDFNVAGPELVNRGFREKDVTALQNYLGIHDLDAMTSRAALPVALSFSKIVKKYDRIKRPIGKDLALSYIYQRNRADAEARREWAEGALKVLDPQSVRVLHSYFGEMHGSLLWAPTDADVGISEMLSAMRRPDYEQRAVDAAKGAQR
jgi:hypothetical protein